MATRGVRCAHTPAFDNQLANQRIHVCRLGESTPSRRSTFRSVDVIDSSATALTAPDQSLCHSRAKRRLGGRLRFRVVNTREPRIDSQARSAQTQTYRPPHHFTFNARTPTFWLQWFAIRHFHSPLLCGELPYVATSVPKTSSEVCRRNYIAYG
jgi:hypothetical protein